MDSGIIIILSVISIFSVAFVVLLTLGTSRKRDWEKDVRYRKKQLKK